MQRLTVSFAKTSFFTLLVLASQTASPCSCVVLLDDADAILSSANNSMYVLLGRVDEVIYRRWLEDYKEKSEIYAEVTVVEMFKGPRDIESVEIDTETSTCSANFQPGHTLLIFGSRSKSNRFASTSLCSSVVVDRGDASKPMGDDWVTKIESAAKILREAELK